MPKAVSVEQYAAQQQIDTLKRSNFDLEKRLHELAEDKRRLEAELGAQKESFVKMHAREQDLLKDIETLRDENSHHTGAIKRLQKEREGLKSTNESLNDQLGSINNKLSKTEKYYKEVEHENLTLEADIKQLMRDKHQLFEEKQKLQVTVEDALKTKENYRSFIKQLREQNQSLESSMSQPGPAAMAAKPEKKRVVLPTTREQKTLGEVMNLREEKLQLQDRLLVAQEEIYSLEMHLKVQDKPDLVDAEGTDGGDGGLVAQLSELRTHVGGVRADLESVQSAVSFFGTQQKAVVREGFKVLASKCREQLLAAGQDRTRLAETLCLTEWSLGKMEEDYKVMKGENAKLHVQRNKMADEVSALKAEVSELRDQKRIQLRQISQDKVLAHEKDAKLGKLELERKQLQEKFSTSERNWKKEYKRLELEWEGRVAEAVQSCELLTEEQEQLMAEKKTMERKMAELSSENQRHISARDEMEAHVKTLEGKMVDVMLKEDENEREICRAREEMAALLVQRAFLSAQLKMEQGQHQEELARMQGENEQVVSGLRLQETALREAVGMLECRNSAQEARLLEIADKEHQVSTLESRITSLTTSQSHLQTEMDALTKKHTKVIKDFRLLEEMEHGRRLENEKVKMTLMTEIELLKSKLSSVEGEREGLQHKLNEIASDPPPPPPPPAAAAATAVSAAAASHGPSGTGSAFHSVPPSAKQVEHLKKQIALLQSESKQQRKINQDFVGNRSTKLTELLNRVSTLETENQHLKDTITSSGTHSSIDDETVANLRKRVTDMTRRTFFLESDKKNLTEKVKGLTASLKSAREAKDHVTTDRVQGLSEENQELRDRVRKLEGDLTKKLMAADARIVETIKENDKLRHMLLTVQSAVVESEEVQSSASENFTSLLKTEGEVLQELKTGLASSSLELEKLEAEHQRIEDLQQQIQATLATEGVVTDEDAAEESVTSPSDGRGLPAVFKSLPAGYISNLQGQRGVSKPSARSASLCISSLELQRKMSEISSVTSSFSENFQRQKDLLERRDSEVGTIQKSLVAMETLFQAETERTVSLKRILSSIHGLDLQSEHLQSVMQRQIEQLQDQVSGE